MPTFRQMSETVSPLARSRSASRSNRATSSAVLRLLMGPSVSQSTRRLPFRLDQFLGSRPIRAKAGSPVASDYTEDRDQNRNGPPTFWHSGIVGGPFRSPWYNSWQEQGRLSSIMLANRSLREIAEETIMATVPRTVTDQDQDIAYPTRDGRPLGETDLHRNKMADLIETLEDHFSGDPDIYVSGNLLVFYERGDRRKHVSPDVFVVRGVPKKPLRDHYLIWREGKAPEFVIEVTSKS